MIPMSCPSCGRRGTVPPDRLNTRMHCKKCDAVFYMDKSGHIVLGDPDDPRKKFKPVGGSGGGGGGGGTATKAKAPKAKKKSSGGGDESPITELIRNIPKQVKIGIVGVAVVAAAFAMGLNPMKLLPKGAPKSLEGRLDYVANKFADEQPGAILSVAVPGTEADLQKWYDTVRPMWAFKGPQKLGSKIVFVPKRASTENGYDNIALNLFVPLPQTPPELEAAKKVNKPTIVPGYNGDGTFDAPTAWVQKDNVWMLDGTKSLELAQAPPPSAGKDSKKK